MDLIAQILPGSVDPVTKLTYVLPTMQLGIRPSGKSVNPEDIPLPLSPPMPPSGLFSEGDANDDFDLSDTDDNNDVQSEIGDIPTDEPLPLTPYPKLFVIGDAADAFGAIKAGHMVYWQVEVAARKFSFSGQNALGCDYAGRGLCKA